LSMKRLLPVLALIFILTGCKGVSVFTDTTASKEPTSPGTKNSSTTAGPSHTAATVALHAVNDSGVYGTATFTQDTEGVEVKLAVSGLTDNGATYLTHIHQGGCPDEAGNAEEHQHDEHEHTDQGEEGVDIEYPLSQISPNPQGRGQSTTVLQNVTIDDLFYSSPKHLNVHAAGSGTPPSIACATMDRAWMYRMGA
jgi:Cu/Zn superoxide dismutase